MKKLYTEVEVEKLLQTLQRQERTKYTDKAETLINTAYKEGFKAGADDAKEIANSFMLKMENSPHKTIWDRRTDEDKTTNHTTK